ncbi:MAG: transglycosylase family protein [Solirubrobacterales bacterium]
MDETHVKPVNRYLKLRKRANRLIAKRDHRKVRPVRDADQLDWSNLALRRESRRLRRLIDRVRWDIRFQRAGITPAVQAHLERIAICESHGNPRAIGGGGTFRGKYQFMRSTWASVGGTGDPAQAPEREQDYRAALLLRRSGSSPWPVCG